MGIRVRPFLKEVFPNNPNSRQRHIHRQQEPQEIVARHRLPFSGRHSGANRAIHNRIKGPHPQNNQKAHHRTLSINPFRIKPIT